MSKILLPHLLKNIEAEIAQEAANKEIEGVQFDSRKIKPGDLFVAVKGTITDGHRFIENAIADGAHWVLCEDLPERLESGIGYIRTENSRHALALIGANWYGWPSKDLSLVGITGTNGKTTSATLLFELLRSMGLSTALVSTNGNRIDDTHYETKHTTPDPLTLQEFYSQAVDAGCTYAVMEVSSHAAHQFRIDGLHFAGAIFTNISHDHLDYHGTFAAYIQAKKRFFDILPDTAFALTNIDDRRGMVMLQNTAANHRTFALHRPSDYKGKVIENTLTGLMLEINNQPFHSLLIGEFNAYNLCAVYGAAMEMGLDPATVLTKMSALRGVRGRFEHVTGPSSGVTGIVDYAHTPDALEKVLETIVRSKGTKDRLITVVGCGGDRDRAKRPKMARIASRFSDEVILTADNPRSEDPAAIIREMMEGLDTEDLVRVRSIEDRKKAIQTAVLLAKARDIVLVAGKGHETYQEINGKRFPFDDMQVLKEALR